MMKRRAKVDYARWVFVLPALLVVGILLIYPIFSSLYYSMTTKHLIRLTYDFIGLENYKAVLADPNFFKAFLNSVLWTLGSLAGQLIIGFTGALAINRVNFGKGIYRTLMIIPWAFPSIVIALSWKWILNGVCRNLFTHWQSKCPNRSQKSTIPGPIVTTTNISVSTKNRLKPTVNW